MIFIADRDENNVFAISLFLYLCKITQPRIQAY